MNVRQGLFHFVRVLSEDRSERRRLAAAVVLLLRHRHRSFRLLRFFLAYTPTFRHSKFQLWQCLSRSYLFKSHRPLSPDDLSELASAIRSTSAYIQASSALIIDRNGFIQRSPEYSLLRRR